MMKMVNGNYAIDDYDYDYYYDDDDDVGGCDNE